MCTGIYGKKQERRGKAKKYLSRLGMTINVKLLEASHNLQLFCHQTCVITQRSITVYCEESSIYVYIMQIKQATGAINC